MPKDEKFCSPKRRDFRVTSTMKVLKLRSKVEPNTCKVDDINLEGCYECKKGSRLTLRCATDFGEAEGHVDCQTQSFPIKCTPNGYKNVVPLFWNKADVDEIIIFP